MSNNLEDDFFTDYFFISDSESEDNGSSESYPDVSPYFVTEKTFKIRKELEKWVRDIGKEHKMWFVVGRTKKANGKGRGRVYLDCERAGGYRYRGSNRVLKRQDTGTKKLYCPFRVVRAEQKDGIWKVQVNLKKSKHNHPLGRANSWHTSETKLSKEELKRVEQLTNSNMKPKQILNHLKKEFPSCRCRLRQVQNAVQKIRMRNMGELTPMQYFFKLMDDHGYRHWHRILDGTDMLGDVIFAHPMALKLMRLYHYVLLMDATYRTNHFEMPMLEVIAMSPSGQNFHVAFAFMKNEKQGSFLWALQKVNELFGTQLPQVIITDRELALMNALEKTFPDSSHLLCRRHNRKNCTDYLNKLLQKKKYQYVFESRWGRVVEAVSEEEYQRRLLELETAWRKLPALLKYLHEDWLVPYKHKFCSAWTKHVLHLGALTTNRVESAHSQLKRWLGTATGNFQSIFVQIHDLVELQLNEVKAEFEKSLTVHLHATKFPLFRRLRGQVLHNAIQLMLKEYNTRSKDVGVDPSKCGCEMKSSNGLICAHQMCQMIVDKIPIDPLDLHDFWRQLHMDIDIGYPKEQQRTTAADLLKDIVEEVSKLSEAKQFYYANMFYNLLHSDVTNIQEPPIQVHKGRPKKRKSTQRDLSGWEQTEKKLSGKKKVSKKSKVVDHGSKSKSDKGTSQKKNNKTASNKEGKPDEAAKEEEPDESKKQFRAYVESQMHPIIVPYIQDCINVKGDGNCGFRVVAYYVYGDENQWLRVRLELMEEMRLNRQLYTYDTAKLYRKAYAILDWDKSPAPEQKWLALYDLGTVIATRYQAVVSCYGRSASYTYLPLRDRILVEVPTLHINFGLLEGVSHFIVLCLTNITPMPTIFIPWLLNCEACCLNWLSVWHERLQDWRKQSHAFNNVQDSRPRKVKRADGLSVELY